jgi:hypothetical protein
MAGKEEPMSLNIGTIFTEVAELYEDEQVDEAELAPGVPVVLPLEPQVGSVVGKPLYFIGTLSTTKQTSNPSPLTESAKAET